MEKAGIQANMHVSGQMYDEAIREQMSVIDFKMVTFSLAGKDYAIDIMQVKEIAKAGSFTYVPNTAPFVLGVYNLRGDIIPIIDLRMFFNIPVQRRDRNKTESMVILTIEEQTFGVVVDSIDKVIGVSKQTIQPPHPIFGDINIKYIHGVVESAGRLYVLLDVNTIFANKKEEQQPETEVDVPSQQAQADTEAEKVLAHNEATLNIQFIKDTLSAFGSFYPSAINEDWLETRYLQWQDMRAGGKIQLENQSDVNEFLDGFLSPDTKQFWSEDYAMQIRSALPNNLSKVINVWNIGCGAGHETYSLAVVLKRKYPNALIRIYANDSDLLAISSAPMLPVPSDFTQTFYEPYLVKAVSGQYGFSKEIKDMILFEYHDCAHQNTVPDIDIIFVRDVLSFIQPDAQLSMLNEFKEKLKKSGVVLLGVNEAMPKHDGWRREVEGSIAVFSKA